MVKDIHCVLGASNAKKNNNFENLQTSYTNYTNYYEIFILNLEEKINKKYLHLTVP